MNPMSKIAIVAVLAVVVGAVVASKRPAASSCCATSPGDVVGLQSRVFVTELPTTQPAVAALPRLVDLGATKCIPCKMMAPILEELKTSMAGKLQVDFIDVWVNEEAGEQYGFRIIPTQIFFDASGKELSRHEGIFSRQDILNRFKQHGIEFTAVE